MAGSVNEVRHGSHLSEPGSNLPPRALSFLHWRIAKAVSWPSLGRVLGDLTRIVVEADCLARAEAKCLSDTHQTNLDGG